MKIIVTERQLKVLGDFLNEQEIDELDYNEFNNSDNLTILRDALNKNKTVSVAFVKQDGTVRHMGVRKYLNSYVPSEREKTEKELNVKSNNDIIRVVDINVYIKTLRETGDKEYSAKKSWRTINLHNVLGFLTGGQFIDLRDENEIMERFGEDVYNGLTRSMVKTMELQQQNVE